jgi:nucleoside-diphosphate-sugar epimerase
VDGETIDLGSGTPTATSDLVHRICRAVGAGIDVDFDARRDRPNEPLRTARVGETRRRIGWEPLIDLDSGLARTVAWFHDLQN